jgi:hypothetical protein
MGLLLALTACATPPPQPPSPTPRPRSPAPPDPCELATTWRQRVPLLREAGKLDRAYRLITRADDRCPASAGDSAADRARIEAELYQPLDERSALALVGEGFAQRDAGDAAGAQRRFDRARVALSRGAETEIGVFHARRALAMDGAVLGEGVLAGAVFVEGVLAEGVLEPSGAGWLAMLAAGRWHLPAPLLAGYGAQSAATGVTFDNADGSWWLPSFNHDPVPEFRPIGVYKDRVVAWNGDGLVVFDPISRTVVAERRPVAAEPSVVQDAVVRGRVVVTYAEPFTMLVSSYSLPSLKPAATVEAAAIMIDSAQPRAVAMGTPGTDLHGGLQRAPTRVVDLNTGKVTRRLHIPVPTFGDRGFVHGFLGDNLVLLRGHALVVVHLKTGATFEVPLDWTNPEERTSKAGPTFTADGRYACVGMDSQLGVVDLRTRRQLHDHAGVAYTCRFRGRRHAAVARIPLPPGYELVRGAAGRAFTGLGEVPLDLAVEDGDRRGVAVLQKAIVGSDLVHHQLVVLDLERQRVLHRLDLGDGYPSIGMTGDLVVRGSVAQLALIGEEGEVAHAIALDTGKRVAASPRQDEEPGRDERQVASPVPAWEAREMEVRSGYLAFRGPDGLRLWSSRRGAFVGEPMRTCAFAISPNEEYLAIAPPCDQPGPVRIVHRATKQERTWTPPLSPLALAIANDGRRLAASARHRVATVDLDDGTTKTTKDEVRDMLWLPNGKLLRTQVGSDGTTLRLQGKADILVPRFGSPESNGDGLVSLGHTHIDLASWSIVDAPATAVTFARHRDGHVYMRQGGKPFATLVGSAPYRAIAFLDDGRVDHLGLPGAPPPNLVCRIGQHLLPYAVCEERWRDDGACRAAFATSL